MPTYQYACTECGHDFEQFQSFSDNALTECPQCSGKLRKVYNAVGVVFKGSGFYRNDSRSPEKTGSESGSEKSSSEKSGSDSSSGASDAGSSGGSGSGDSSTPAKKTDAAPAAAKPAATPSSPTKTSTPS